MTTKTIRKILLTFLALSLFAVLLVSCDAPGVRLLDELLPPLTEKNTGYTVTEAIVVTRLATGDSVEFTTPTEMEAFHQRLEGVKCIRDKDREGLLSRYAISFITDGAADTLYVVSDKDFIFEDYHYEAMRGGVDMVYLESLFPVFETPDIDVDAAEEP